MNRKYYYIILIWLIAVYVAYEIDSRKITKYTNYKIIEGNISKIKCSQPLKRYLDGDVILFYNNNRDSLKFQSSFLRWEDFNTGCQSLKKKINIGQYLNAKVYDSFNLVGDVFVGNENINDGKKAVISRNASFEFFKYFPLLVALLMTVGRMKKINKINKKVLDSKYFTYVLYFVALMGIIRFLFHL